MSGYVGTSEDKRRILRQEREREQQRQVYEDARNKGGGAALREFGSGTSEALENAFKNETVGLVTRQEFVEKRQTLADRLAADEELKRAANEESEWQERDRQRAKRLKAEQKNKLSFEDDVDEEEEEEEGHGVHPPLAAPREELSSKAAPPGKAAPEANPGGAPRRFATLGKDPSVQSDFLPDRDRERQEEELRQALKREWALRQAVVKAEPLEITYSYWNGSGHRRQITVRKGDSVGVFLKAVQEQLAAQFREIRTCGVSGLMYVKEDIILPHTVTFYELIQNQAQGKSGPLFQFDLQQMAATAFDPRLKAQDSHAGKVVERHWFNRHKHIFPYSRWEVYDEAVHVPGGAESGAEQGG